MTSIISTMLTSHQPIMKSTKPKVGEEESSEDEAAGELSKVNFIFCNVVEIETPSSYKFTIYIQK